jgi:hypothetical protein
VTAARGATKARRQPTRCFAPRWDKALVRPDGARGVVVLSIERESGRSRFAARYVERSS